MAKLTAADRTIGVACGGSVLHCYYEPGMRRVDVRVPVADASWAERGGYDPGKVVARIYLAPGGEVFGDWDARLADRTAEPLGRIVAAARAAAPPDSVVAEWASKDARLEESGRLGPDYYRAETLSMLDLERTPLRNDRGRPCVCVCCGDTYYGSGCHRGC